MTDGASVLEKEDELVVAGEGSLGVIRLNRPKALNALTLDMVRAMSAALDRFETDPSVGVILLEGAGERGLCAGGDIRGLYESIRAGGDLGSVFWREEYILNARIASLKKPYVSFMDGVVMGGGVGLSAHGAHRVVTDRTQLAMPETGIGFFPDVGGTWLLSRAPGQLGTYYGLTGQSMTGMDAIRCGFADVLIPAARLDELRQALVRLGPEANNGMVRGVLAHFALPRGAAPIDEHRKTIDASMDRDSVADIISALEQDTSEFAQGTVKTLRTKSPTSLKLTLRLLREAKASTSLRQCLVREYGAALEIFINRDFPEGIRAAVIDKDRSPKWSPASLEEVTPAVIDAYFAPRGANELVFPDREV
ncbi:enoyl-CoA hydratase/isomerase family protein [Bradyrhizobium sp. LHD-71]|uniref:enoyl-CoA hydratase/isomerase family protein n=1 Tax=Bradyrhizobium sp. LHD-71 TaxID=3072141 RepID=UPI00280E1E85|nr:enoyl-CoA hydratase/isomerase family protein [Bradyrhizobium sp. LHD-71]MDQ8730826.1 enoyl-CoA hydratase/isomerase family protein [Bradyrhizobium sp. LHD-71]